MLRAMPAALMVACLLGACAPALAPAAVTASRAEAHPLVSEGVASWYGPGFAGRRTASGEVFDPSELTAAHRTLPFNTRVRVTNLANGQSVVVRINDRGPFKGGRVIDLSRAAAESIGLVGRGTGPVRLELVSNVGGLLPAAADPQLPEYDVVANGRSVGELLLLGSDGAEPVVVRVVGTRVPPDAGAEVLLSDELYALLGPDVRVLGGS